MIKAFSQLGQAFKVLVGIFPYGTDQSSSRIFDRPGLLRKTFTHSVIHDGRSVKTGQLGLSNDTFIKPVGALEVVDNDFDAPVEIILGNYKFTPHLDFMIGVGVDDTAHNLASLISKMPEFSATSEGAVITILYDGGPTLIDLKVLHHGDTENLTVTPFTEGSPWVSPPTIG